MAEKLLCIDDEQRILDLLIEELSEQGYTVHGAASGHEGFAAILRLNPDLVICDINMPGMLGTDAAEIILKDSPSIRIAIFSANVQDTMQVRANSIGTTFVAKPVTEKSIAVVLDYFAR